MKTKTNNKGRKCSALSSSNLINKSIVYSALILTGIQSQIQAQTATTKTVQTVKYKQPSLWIGAAAAANFNFYDGSTQKLNSDLTIPVAFHGGNGIGLFVGPLIEYHRADSRWGVMLQGGYDSRKGTFKAVKSPCNCPNDLSTNLSYITVEPNLRFAPFKGRFYLFGGPRLAFNLSKSFTYQLGVNPEYPEQALSPAVTADFSDVKQTLVSMQIGTGYDIPLSAKNHQNQFVFSPFVSFLPYFGQAPRTIETWNVTTIRGGASLKFGHGRKINEPKPFDSLAVAKKEIVPVKKDKIDSSAFVKNTVVEPNVTFAVNSPNNIPGDKKVRETFPLRNYVFFDKGKTEIPSRYVLLTKDQVSTFKQDQLEVMPPSQLTGHSKRQMNAYYNILNILGDRMQKKPTTTIKLVGSSEQGQSDGVAMAQSVKMYLVNVFGIAENRIATVGQNKPEIPSEHPGGTKELDLLIEGDRRVSIETASPTLLMEFQSGPDAPLAPVQLTDSKEAPLDSYVTFNATGLSTWSLVVTDETGKVQNFGPYTEEKMSLPGKSILGTRAEGDYKIAMIGLTKDGKTVTKETTSHVVLWTPSKTEEEMRFSVIFDFDRSKVTSVYQKYLTNVVAPKIPKGATVVINGYTDVVGDPAHNLKLSQARAQEVHGVLLSALMTSGRGDVKFQVNGSGEDEKLSPFENKYPEERFYNRTVVIDMVPNK